MGRHVSMERRRELALAAFEAIRTRGLYGITMSELAGLLGLKRSTAYWYFRDLGHVFEIVLEHVLERQRAFLVERMRSLVQGEIPGQPTAPASATAPTPLAQPAQFVHPPHPPHPPHPVDALYAYVEGIWAFFSAEGPYLLQLVSFWGHTVGGEPGRVIEVTQRHFQPLWNLAVHELERGMEAGRVERCDARAVVDLVTSLVDGVLVHRVIRGMDAAPVGGLLWTSVLGPLRRPRAGRPCAPTRSEQSAAPEGPVMEVGS